MKVCLNPAYYSAGAPKGTPLDLTYKDKVTGSRFWKRSTLVGAGVFRVCMPYDEFFDSHVNGKKGREYLSRPIKDPTYGQVFNCFKTGIMRTGDLHHSFFEGVEVKGDIIYITAGS